MFETPSQIEALLTQAAFAPINNLGWIRVTGSDRVRWLNGMVTNSIQALKPAEGCYNFLLNAQGRIQGDCTAWLRENSILLETGADRVAGLMELLDRFIIMDDVELAPVERRAGLLLAGPDAHRMLLAALDLQSLEVEAMGSVQLTWQSANIDLLHAYSGRVPRYELWADPATLGLVVETLKLLQVSEASAEALEQLRILEGVPLYGVDIRDKELAQETGQTRALHFSKGCYLGQEIVERIRSRGQVHRIFATFTLTGAVPDPGTALLADGKDKPVGELTSIATVGEVTHALGYIRREALETKAALTYPGGTATPVP